MSILYIFIGIGADQEMIDNDQFSTSRGKYIVETFVEIEEMGHDKQFLLLSRCIPMPSAAHMPKSDCKRERVEPFPLQLLSNIRIFAYSCYFNLCTFQTHFD